MPATAARCGRAPASRRAAISVSAGVRTLTTTAWAQVALDDHHDREAVGPQAVLRLECGGQNAPRGVAEAGPPSTPRLVSDAASPQA